MMTAQVCDVSKPLLSVRKVVNAGNKVTFSQEGCFIEDGKTGEWTKLDEKGGLYVLRAWVRKDGSTVFRGRARACGTDRTEGRKDVQQGSARKSA